MSPDGAFQREHRSLVCDVFEHASRGAAAAFIASQTDAKVGDNIHCKQQRSVDTSSRQQQPTAMLFLCALACFYEVSCRHWKLVRKSLCSTATMLDAFFVQAVAGGILLAACILVPIIAALRLLGNEFHFELH